MSTLIYRANGIADKDHLSEKLTFLKEVFMHRIGTQKLKQIGLLLPMEGRNPLSRMKMSSRGLRSFHIMVQLRIACADYCVERI